MNIFKKAAELEEQNRAFALITITKSIGSTPRSNARMIVLSDGTTFGTVGGGVSEYAAIGRALELIPMRKSEHFEQSLKVSQGHNCGGELEFYIEVINPLPRLILVGGGHVNLEIARLAFSCGFYVEIVETRVEYANSERFPFVRTFYVDETIEKALEKVSIDEKSGIIIATHALDKQALESVIFSKAFYIGMLGSRTKVHNFKRHLKETLNIDADSLTHFFAPIGLDIGARTPTEIAVSVVSELMATSTHTSKKSLRDKSENLVIVRGAGDLATATILRLHKAGYRVLALEIEHPTTIRRTVSFSSAMYTGEMKLENVICKRVQTVEEAKSIMDEQQVAIMNDPKGESISALHPSVVVDAIIAKRNLGTHMSMAPFVIALGPGFEARKDCNVVIETMRGHNLGTIITSGSAIPNTGEPGLIGGESSKRVIHSSYAGVFKGVKRIGDIVKEGEVIALIGEKEVKASLSGVIRGLLSDNLEVPVGFKIGDIDPRGDIENCYSVSDKGRAIAGAVLEAVDSFHNGRRQDDVSR